ncbi:MAG: hypothetical protein P8X73_14780 [Ignavibacteriaceae bacterium]
MKYFILILLIPFVLCYSQDDKSNNPIVELPDFVITGQEEVSIKRTDKIQPEFVSTITESFVIPYHSPEELGLRQLSNPIKKELNLLDSTKYFNGSLNVAGGIYIIPDADLSYHYPFNNGLLNAKVGGVYQRPYIDNSGRKAFYGGAGIEYTIGIENNGLSGTNFSLNGDYASMNYKLFASENPETMRTKNVGNYSFGIKNTAGKLFIIDLGVKDYLSSLTEDNFNENLLSASGFAKLQLSDIGLGLKTNYQKQFLNTDSLNDASYNYFFLRPTVSFELFNSVKAEVGFSINNKGGEKFNDIYAAFGLKLSDKIVLMGEFAPQAEFVTSGTLLRKNDYFNALGFDNLLFRKANYLNAAIKYEYATYYQIDAGVRHYKSGNYPYFTDSELSGQFDIATADAEELGVYLNLQFHSGPYGVFYFNIDYYNIENKDGNRLPYYPLFKSNFTYGYELSKGWLAEILFDYNSDRYTDIENTDKLSSFFNLGAKVTYKLHDSFLLKLELSNLLNREIFYWSNYQEKPFDLLVGFNLLFD